MNTKLENILKAALHFEASDIHIKANSVPKIRTDGILRGINTSKLSNDDIEVILRDVMDERTYEVFERANEVDFAFEVPNLGRFRFNAYVTRGVFGMIGRVINDTVPTLSNLGIPAIAAEQALLKNGLIIVSGATGAGKSTTLAAMINHINKSRNCHIVTIEDPIEIVHSDIRSSISQREISSDTKNFSTALRSVLRQDPDVIMVGEMRDTETARAAIKAAETGHLVLTTLHTTNASETINRLIDMFPAHEHRQIRVSLASSLRAILCQRLLDSTDGGRIPIVEVLTNRGRTSGAILEEIKVSFSEIIKEDANYGMQSFDENLVDLLREGKITIETALSNTDATRELSLQLRRLGLDKPMH